ncbi:hypothetical protein KI387_018941, partial [Taxus chinensis]
EGVVPEGMKTLEKKQLAIRAAPYLLINRDLYKLGWEEVLCRCVLEHERLAIMEQAHEGSVGGNYAGDATT